MLNKWTYPSKGKCIQDTGNVVEGNRVSVQRASRDIVRVNRFTMQIAPFRPSQPHGVEMD